MKKNRPLPWGLAAVAGGLALCAPVILRAQSAVQIAAVSTPTESIATPAPDAQTDEKSPPTDASGKDDITETDIDAATAATFNSKDRVAVFTGNVKVVDPRFQLVCDRLTVFLNKPAPAGQNAAATPTPMPVGKTGKGKGDPQVQAPGGGGIDHALAEGHVVILQKKAQTKEGEEEKISIGRGQSGTFDNKTGDMVLKGWPSLEQNGSSLIATSAGTVMTIHRDSSLDTTGPSKTKLIQKGKGGSSFDLFPSAASAPTNDKRPGGGRRGAAAPAATPATNGVR